MAPLKRNVLYVACAYALFWALTGAIYLLFSKNEAAFTGIMGPVQIIGAWTPTIVLLLLFRKLLPGMTVKQFFRQAFSGRLDWKLMVVVAVVLLAVTVGAIAITAPTAHTSFPSLLNFSLPTLASGLIFSIVSGATGEESGWRGYLQRSLEDRHSVLVASFIVGVIWAIWHAPQWLLAAYNGVTGSGLVEYIVLDSVLKICLAMIIGICFSHCRNLIVPMWIHFLSNFYQNLLNMPTMDLQMIFLRWFIVLHCVAAIGFVAWHLRVKSQDRTLDVATATA